MKYLSKLLIVIFFIPAVSQAQAGLDTLSLESIFYAPLLAGNRPDFSSFSPDLSHVYYHTNDSSMSEEEFFQVTLKGTNNKPVPDKVDRSFDVSPNEKKLVYNKDGDIWIADLNFENKTQIID